MGRTFVLPEDGIGPGGDIIIRKHKGAGDGWYRLFVGDQFMGQIIKDTVFRSWHAISWNRGESEFFQVHSLDGFATWRDAAAFIIKHHNYWMRDERESRRQNRKVSEQLDRYKECKLKDKYLTYGEFLERERKSRSEEEE